MIGYQSIMFTGKMNSNSSQIKYKFIYQSHLQLVLFFKSSNNIRTLFKKKNLFTNLYRYLLSTRAVNFDDSNGFTNKQKHQMKTTNLR